MLLYINFLRAGGQQSDVKPTASCTRARIRDIPNSAVLRLTYRNRIVPDSGPRAKGRLYLAPRVLDKCVPTWNATTPRAFGQYDWLLKTTPSPVACFGAEMRACSCVMPLGWENMQPVFTLSKLAVSTNMWDLKQGYIVWRRFVYASSSFSYTVIVEWRIWLLTTRNSLCA